MCGRGSLTKVEKELEQRFNASFYSDDLVRYNPLPNFNIAPTHVLPIIPSDDSQHFHPMRWGFIPSWAKDTKIGASMINARIETIMEKAFFRTAFTKKRCLVPMDGFYEWKIIDHKTKIPYRITLTNDSIFSMAGIYSVWQQGSQQIESFSIITQPANEFMKSLHDRMPAILLPEHEKLWLDPLADIEYVKELIYPYPDHLLKAYPVSAKVNSVKNNDASLITEEYKKDNTLF